MSKVVYFKNAETSEAIRHTLNGSTLFIMNDVTKFGIINERPVSDYQYYELKNQNFVRIVRLVSRLADTICNIRLYFKYPVKDFTVKISAGCEIPSSLVQISDCEYKVCGLDENNQFFFGSCAYRDFKIELLIPISTANKNFISALDIPDTINLKEKILGTPDEELMQLMATWGYFDTNISRKVLADCITGELSPPIDRCIINPFKYI